MYDGVGRIDEFLNARSACLSSNTPATTTTKQIFPLRVAEVCAWYASTTPEMRVIKGAAVDKAAAGAKPEQKVELKGQAQA